METQIISALLNNDTTIFAILFIYLFFKQLRNSEVRENKLYSFLDNMKDEFAKLVKQYERLSNDVEDIKEELKYHKGEK